VLKARDRSSARDPEAQLRVSHRRAHDPHVSEATAIEDVEKVSAAPACGNVP
jgi:hypothetical protein